MTTGPLVDLPLDQPPAEVLPEAEAGDYDLLEAFSSNLTAEEEEEGHEYDELPTVTSGGGGDLDEKGLLFSSTVDFTHHLLVNVRIVLLALAFQVLWLTQRREMMASSALVVLMLTTKTGLGGVTWTREVRHIIQFRS